jgi:hypothetical protein
MPPFLINDLPASDVASAGPSKHGSSHANLLGLIEFLLIEFLQARPLAAVGKRWSACPDHDDLGVR